MSEINVLNRSLDALLTNVLLIGTGTAQASVIVEKDSACDVTNRPQQGPGVSVSNGKGGYCCEACAESIPEILHYDEVEAGHGESSDGRGAAMLSQDWSLD